MDFQFKNLRELMARFSDDAKCRAYLEYILWHGTPICPHCKSVGAYKLGDNKTYKCKNKECRKKFTVTVGTVFENSNVPLHIWFAAIFLSTAHKKGISSCQLARDLGITQKTAWFMLHRIREIFKEKAPYLIKRQVQIDETYVGGRETNKHASKKSKDGRGRRTDIKTPVLGIYEKEGMVAVKVLPFVSRKQVQKIITEKITKDCTVVTDAFIIYPVLARENGYKHIVVNHAKGEYVKDGFHTNGVENFWSQLKRGIIGIYHQVSPEHLQRYCDEFAARYNTRKIKDHERFVLTLGLSRGRLKYFDLIQKENGLSAQKAG